MGYNRRKMEAEQKAKADAEAARFRVARAGRTLPWPSSCIGYEPASLPKCTRCTAAGFLVSEKTPFPHGNAEGQRC